MISTYAVVILSSVDKNTESFGFLNWLWLVIPAILIFFWVWAKLTYYFYKYELRDDGFRKELGVIRKKYITIPYDRIQNVNIDRGVIARVLGLSDLSIETAGAGGQIARSEGMLPGLSQKIAEELRDELVKRSRQSRSTQGL